MGFFFGKKDRDLHKLSCRQHDGFLSVAEHALYRVLRLAIGDTFAICPKVNFRDIFYVEQPQKDEDLKIQVDEKQITFLLCDIGTMKPEVGVELDESPPEQQPEKAEEGIQVEEIFEAGGLPFVRIFVSPSYNPNDLRERIFEAVSTVDEPLEGQASEDGKKGEEDDNNAELLARGKVPESWKDQSIWENRQAQEDSPSGSLPGSETVESPASAEGLDTDASPASVDGDQSEDPAVPGLPDEESATAGESGASIGELHSETPSTQKFLFGSGPGTGQETVSHSPPVPGQFPTTGESEKIEDEFSGSGAMAEQAAGTETASQEQAGDTASTDGSEYARPRSSLTFGEKPDSFETPFEKEFKRKMEEAAAKASEQPPPLCPNCQLSMVLRTSKRNTKFYACTNFPSCKEFKGLLE